MKSQRLQRNDYEYYLEESKRMSSKRTQIPGCNEESNIIYKSGIQKRGRNTEEKAD